MANSAYNPFVQFVDSNGDVLSGGKWHFYVNGTDTDKAIYQDEALASPHQNPVVADANGVFPEIWLDGVYSIKVTDSADVEVETMDDYNKRMNDIDTELASTEAPTTQYSWDEDATSTTFTMTGGYYDKLDGSSILVAGFTKAFATGTHYVYFNEVTEVIEDNTSAGGVKTKALYEVVSNGTSIIVTDTRAGLIKDTPNATQTAVGGIKINVDSGTCYITTTGTDAGP